MILPQFFAAVQRHDWFTASGIPEIQVAMDGLLHWATGLPLAGCTLRKT
jgi:hypothetical protein